MIIFPAIVLGFVPWWIILVLAPIYIVTLGWGVFDIGSQFFTKTYWKGEKGTVSFTFDDGPHPEHTSRVLDILREEKVKATFFCIGRNAEKHPLLLKEIMEDGHTIGNHTYNHTYVFSKSAAEKQIIEGQEAIEKITGKTPAYFRPPFGVMTPDIARAAIKEKSAIIGWDLRSRDGTSKSVKAILSRVRPRLKDATVLLFHDTNPYTPKALREVIHLCRENGMEIVSLPEQSGIKPYKS